jgi:hypothetical protein
MKIKNWSKFQHFKDRRPTWIKLYRDIIDDKEWFRLSGEAAKFLTFLWILASEDETRQGCLPDIETISWRYRVDIKVISILLSEIQHFLIIPAVYQDDIKVISNRYQVDIPEKRREETEEEKEKSREEVVASDKPKRPAQQKMTDDEWIESIKSNPAYQGIDVDREYGKMTAWCQTNSKQATRKRFLNWLNRVDRPMNDKPQQRYSFLLEGGANGSGISAAGA